MRRGLVGVLVAVAGACTLGLACGGDSGGGSGTPSAGTGGGGVSCEADGVCQPVCASDPDCASTGGSAGIGGSETGGDGGTLSSGGTGTGGEPVGGTSGVGGAGGAGPVGEVGDLGAPCSPAASLACAGNYQKVTLICGASGTWEASDTCPGDQICDTTPGVNAGTCQDQEANCLGLNPGDSVCVDNDVHQCTADNLSTTPVEACGGLCTDGVCDPFADPCPTGDNVTNCASDCGGVSADCVFTLNCPSAFVPDYGDVGTTHVIRLPGASEACTCHAGGVELPLWDRFLLPLSFRVSVGPPWRIVEGRRHTGEPEQFADCGEVGTSGCVVSHVTPELVYRNFSITTDQPDVPPRNVTIEIVDQDAACP